MRATRETWIFRFIFISLSGLLIIFIALPLGATIFSTTPAQLADTMVDPEVNRSLFLTFGSALTATLLAVLGGIPLAYLLARHKFSGKWLVESLVNLPIVIPHTAAGIALLMVFGSRGLLGKAFLNWGIIFTDSFWGIVVAMLFVGLPYLVNTSREAFALVDVELESVALVEGASHWEAFWYVTLPIAWRGVFTGATVMWARGVSEFGAVVILAYHPKIMPVLVYERFEGYGLKAAQPVAVVLLVTVLIVFGLLQYSMHLHQRRTE